MIVIDPKKISDGDKMKETIRREIEYIKGGEPSEGSNGVHVPGEGMEKFHKDHDENGIFEEIDYSEETDNGFWDCHDTGNVRIKEGEFYAVWPLEPHCPLCKAGDENKTVRKIIAKVKVKR